MQFLVDKSHVLQFESHLSHLLVVKFLKVPFKHESPHLPFYKNLSFLQELQPSG